TPSTPWPRSAGPAPPSGSPAGSSTTRRTRATRVAAPPGRCTRSPGSKSAAGGNSDRGVSGPRADPGEPTEAPVRRGSSALGPVVPPHPILQPEVVHRESARPDDDEENPGDEQHEIDARRI